MSHQHNRDRNLVAIFDIIGSYFVDMVYNHLYLRACDNVKAGKQQSITDAYYNNVKTYMSGINHVQIYTRTFKRLYEYYMAHTQTVISIYEFEDKVVSKFIPPEYFGSFTPQDKDKILHDIIVKTVNQFGAFVLEKMLRAIIDEHTCENNITRLQDYIVDLFFEQREMYFARFAEEISRQNGNDKVDRRLFDRLRDAFIEEKRRRLEIQEDLERATRIIIGLRDMLNKLNSELKAARSTISSWYGRTDSSANVMSPRPTVPTVQPEPRDNILIESEDDKTTDLTTAPDTSLVAEAAAILSSLDNDPGFGS